MVIKRVEDSCFDECVNVIRNSFTTVAKEFNLTKENAPTNPAFIEMPTLIEMKKKGIEMYGAYEDGICMGFVAIERASEDLYYMEKLAVLPKHRHKGIGTKLIDFVVDRVKKSGGKKVSIGIINENKRLKDWYTRNGFVETRIKHFSHLPFEVCFMEKVI